MPDPAGLLDLPEGFSYRVISRLGDAMDDGGTVPDRADGMGCFDLGNGEIAGFEALMRWDHPKRGNISPTEFIPIAEMSDLIEPLGMFALERASGDLMDWERQTGELPIFVSVNLSSAQLISSEIYNDIRAMLVKTQCDPKRIKLELTESVVMENPEQARLMLQKLKDTGISLALDDFGTGYSSLETLRAFPFDKIKLDRFFAAELEGNIQSTAILRAVLALGSG